MKIVIFLKRHQWVKIIFRRNAVILILEKKNVPNYPIQAMKRILYVGPLLIFRIENLCECPREKLR
jgi:hypothetical protein